MNTVIYIVGAILLLLLIAMVYKDQIERVRLEQKLKDDYRKAKDEEGDEDPERIPH